MHNELQGVWLTVSSAVVYVYASGGSKSWRMALPNDGVDQHNGKISCKFV